MPKHVGASSTVHLLVLKYILCPRLVPLLTVPTYGVRKAERTRGMLDASGSALTLHSLPTSM